MKTIRLARSLMLAAGLTLLATVAAATTRLDILVVYTPAARAANGGTSGMKAAVNSYVAAANLAYRNSDIDLVLKLVGCAEIAYTESGKLATDLPRLTGTTDGFMDSVHALRTSCGADLVSLIVNSGSDAAGIGYLWSPAGSASFAQYAFSVSIAAYAGANLTFPHEVGHNLGCGHSRADGGSGAYSYSYGYHFNGTNGTAYRTVMAYAPGTRVPYFSNPSISYQGAATGVAEGGTAADNARTIETSVTAVGAMKAVVGTRASGVRGDFDGDGQPDLMLWNSTTGAVEFWLMSGVYRASTVAGISAAAPWRLAAAADMNADGKSDLIWENTSTGARVVWYMNGTTRTGSAALPTAAAAWRIVGAGNFNTDTKADLVLENTTTGAHLVWYMNGATSIGSATLLATTVAWHVAAVADLNNDGKTDLIFENTTDGTHAVWYMNGVTRTSSASISTVATAWKIAGAADFNGDGKTDLVWDNTVDGTHSVWYMNGATRTGSASLPSAAAALKISNH